MEPSKDPADSRSTDTAPSGELARLKEDFARTVHDLRGPLGAATNAAYILAHHHDQQAKAKASEVLQRQLGILKAKMDELSALTR